MRTLTVLLFNGSCTVPKLSQTLLSLTIYLIDFKTPLQFHNIYELNTIKVLISHSKSKNRITVCYKYKYVYIYLFIYSQRYKCLTQNKTNSKSNKQKKHSEYDFAANISLYYIYLYLESHCLIIFSIKPVMFKSV